MSDFPINHCLLAFTQVHVYWVGDAIWSSHPLSPSFPVAFNLSQNQDLFQWFGSMQQCGQNIVASALASVLSMNIQGWFPLGLTGLISLQSRGLSSVFWSTTQPPLWSNCQTIALSIRTFVGTVMSLLFNMLSRFAIAFLSRSKWLLISWLQSPTTVILELNKRKSVTASTFPPTICHEVMGTDTMILDFLMLSFKPTFSPSSFG